MAIFRLLLQSRPSIVLSQSCFERPFDLHGFIFVLSAPRPARAYRPLNHVSHPLTSGNLIFLYYSNILKWNILKQNILERHSMIIKTYSYIPYNNNNNYLKSKQQTTINKQNFSFKLYSLALRVTKK